MNDNEIKKETAPMEIGETDRLLNSIEVANKLRVSVTTLYNFQKKKMGPPCVRIGRTYKYPLRPLLEYINKHLSNQE